jgi:N-acyl-phosphatidylethanolamine-hydrolysing phospholipase D
MLRTLTFLTLAVTLGACAQSPAIPDPARPHHRPGGFRNNFVDFTPKGLVELLHWRALSIRDGLPRPPREPIPVVEPDLAFIHANARAGSAMQPAATWIGHATVLMQLGGLNMLTDPIFSERASPLSFVGPRRHQPPGLRLDQLPRIDLVLVSHNHYDHCDADSLLALNRQNGGAPLFVVPLGLKDWLAGLGITRAVELDWWQSHRLDRAEVMLTPVQHWSGRGLHDRMDTLWGGFAVLTPGFDVFHAGDTGYSADFAEIRRRLAARQGRHGFDLALLPIGGYEPRWFMASQHVNPDESVRMHRDLGARRSLGMHWGTFELTDESLDEAPRALAQARRAGGLAEEEFFVLAIGQTERFAARPELPPLR